MAAAKFVYLLLLVGVQNVVGEGAASWCVARSDASNDALQTALDYACGAGADCLPLQAEGLCFLPNTIQAHSSYAFNSYYQRRARAPGSCDFAGTATIATSDPSYGSCVYPSTASAAGGANTPITTPPMNNNPNVPTSTTTPLYGGGNSGGLTPGMTTPFPDTSTAPSEATATWFFVFFSSLVVTIIS
ncbi:PLASMODESMATA CALLOSE-BINDING PROTEIN 3-like [Vigna unguiculata]|uniref:PLASMODESMATA CALLOSE-BINDING PROTEIN 3-like n=1 Tax=Vigna unguiculata TaxID=3917 RepID=UPI001017013B|nr:PLASMODESMATA CALLOSE-BINDING PROTEIN 3-like [Vigna unguiculata]